MSSKYINNSAYATTGYTLSGVNQSITIGPMGVIGGPGLVGGTKEAYSILNRGRVVGSSIGIYLNAGGSVTNSGSTALISGYADGLVVAGGRGVVANSGSIKATDSFQSVGVLLDAGGSVSNGAATALIEGYDGVVIKNAVGTVANVGKIEGLNNGSIGIYLGKGGSISNVAGALIEGTKAGIESLSGAVVNGGIIEATGSFDASIGVFLDTTGSVSNVNAGSVIKGSDGVYIKGTGSVNNTGSIIGAGTSSSIGVELYVGGAVVNNAGALIEGERNAVLVAGGTIYNSGRITAVATNGRGVYLDTSSSHLANDPGGVIRGFYGALGGTITNGGTIIGTGQGVHSGFVVNDKSGLIEGNVGVFLDLGTLITAGTIASTAGANGVAVNLTSIGSLLVDDAGARFTGKVEANAGNMDLAGTNGTLTGLGTQFTDFSLVDEVAGASWTFAGANTIPSQMLLSGTTTLTGALTGGSLLEINGGTVAVNTGATIGVPYWEPIKAAVNFNIGLNFAGLFNEATSTFSLKTHTFALTGRNSLDGGSVVGGGGGAFATHGTVALNGFTVTGSATWQDFGTVGESVALTLGSASGGTGTLTVEAKAVWNIGQNVGIAVPAGGKAAVNNAGLFEKTAGTGVSTITPAIVNTGTISVTAGTLNLQGAVSGTGKDQIGQTGTLRFDGQVTAGQTVTFTTTKGGDLTLNDPTGTALNFLGTIKGFSGADKLDLPTFAFANTPKLSFQQNGQTGVLTVVDGNLTAKITLFGQFMATGFKTAKDVGTGTVITYTPPAAQVALAAPHH